jgi:hypothetical protein
MTADFIARILEDKLNKLDANNPKSIEDFNRAGHLLNQYVYQNFLTFEMTDLVREYCGYLCDERILFENAYRQYGFGCDRKEFFKEYIKDLRFFGY